ncbi:MAG: hypothetical protein RL068_1106, partial [Actinomycetota bacterium]
MKRQETQIDQLANQWVRKQADFYPSFATSIGYPGGEGEMDDYSPEALSQEQRDIKSVIANLETLEPADEIDLVTKEALLFSLHGEVESYDSGLSFRNLNNIASPAQGVRDVFDISPTATISDWEHLASRMRKVGFSLEGYARTLEEGVKRNDAPAPRQVLEAIEQVEQITNADGFFHQFAKNAKSELGDLPASLMKELEEAAITATQGYAAFGEYLKSLLPRTSSPDAIGRERYQILSRRFLGATVDLDETYEWGRQEL